MLYVHLGTCCIEVFHEFTAIVGLHHLQRDLPSEMRLPHNPQKKGPFRGLRIYVKLHRIIPLVGAVYVENGVEGMEGMEVTEDTEELVGNEDTDIAEDETECTALHTVSLSVAPF